MSLVALGAGIAVLSGIGAGIGIGIATSGATQDSRRQPGRLIRHCCLDVRLQNQRQSMAWLLQSLSCLYFK